MESVANRLLKIDELLISADPISRLHLTQERIDLDAEAIRLANVNGAEPDFSRWRPLHQGREVLRRTHGMTYSAWRQIGVEADVLEKAGIVRLRKPGPPPPAQGEPALAAPAAAPKPADSAKVEPPPPEEGRGQEDSTQEDGGQEGLETGISPRRG